MSSATVYHYTKMSSIGSILGKYREPGNKPGLEPRRAVGRTSDKAFNTRAIFGLLEPEPKSWTENVSFPVTWPTLQHDLSITANGVLLLELKLDPNTDKVFVADRGHIEGALYDGQTEVPEKYQHASLAEGEEAFLDTMAPLSVYQEQSSRLQYSLPEVLILSSVPAESIRVSETQPLLERELLGNNKELKNVVIGMIERGYASKELKAWRNRFEAEHGKLEQEDLSHERARRK